MTDFETNSPYELKLSMKCNQCDKVQHIETRDYHRDTVKSEYLVKFLIEELTQRLERAHDLGNHS